MKKLLSTFIILLVLTGAKISVSVRPVHAQTMFTSFNYPSGIVFEANLVGDTASSPEAAPSSSTSVRDSSGYGNTGTWHGTPSGTVSGTWYSLGYAGRYAGSFDGSTNYITASTFTPPLGSAARMVLAWINPASCPSGNGVFAMYGTDSSLPYGYGMYLTGACKISVEFDSGAGKVTSSASVSTAAWNCVAATYDGATNSVYVNGVFSGSQSYTLANTQAGGLNIGAWVGGAAKFPGLIGFVLLLNRAPSAGEIAQICQSHA